MKKNYNQPVVEAAQVQLNTIVLAGSPQATPGITTNQNDPIPDNYGGD